MTILIAGIILWATVHLLRRLAPGVRDKLIERIGLGPVKGIISLLSFAALALIVVGFKTTPSVAIYDPPTWGIYVNNLLMLIAVVLFGMGNSRGRLRPLLRHPMLTGVMVWAIAHLLVNGDNASLVLFPAMLVWAAIEMLAINATAEPWLRPEPGPAIYDLQLIGISLAIFAVIGIIHGYIGPSPFAG